MARRSSAVLGCTVLAALMGCAHGTGVCPHATSFIESNEFFCQSDAGWTVRKEIARAQYELNVQHRAGAPGRNWHQNNWEPEWHCELLERIGPMGDGGKWMCDPRVLMRHASCLVYSFGSNNDFRFEQAVLSRWPHCEIHTFDHTSRPPPTPIKGVTFHPIGLGGATDSVDPPLKTLATHIRELGHQGRHIHVLKIDVEGAEYAAFEELFKSGGDILRNVREILIEIHWDTPQGSVGNGQRIHDFFMELHKIGYLIFSKEPNTLGCGGDCIEYSLIYMGPSLLSKPAGSTHRRMAANRAQRQV